ncbi:hypothetical protein DNTS_033708 [Danionella cerebrum]|uniref:Uncharacterized protein n=1 Tax=Danionella cerebrum TaxID=2873325 RepID=A0A553Q0Y0_9TELE|nr:hypothetical protein DNTS_033708 [Danionella translucida]
MGTFVRIHTCGKQDQLVEWQAGWVKTSTPWGEASACEFAEIVELLLKAGADPSIKDQEGSLPEEVTESSAISFLLRQYTAPKG